MSLWGFAIDAYGRPGVETLCLTLQDEHGQCAPLLLWRLWALDRPVDEVGLRRAADLARTFEATAVGPLRAARRGLRDPIPAVDDVRREALRRRVKAAELEAERLLIETLEAATEPGRVAPVDPVLALALTASAWGQAAPASLLAPLAAACAAVSPDHKVLVPSMAGAAGPGGGDAAVRIALADLRLIHQDLDAAIEALETVARPDQVRIARLKKRKLGLRDQMTRLEERLTPDIIA